MEKLERIEKLRERAQVSYDEAREAYEACDGDLLDALIYLERQGKVQPPQGGGYYKSEYQGEQENGFKGANEQTQEGKKENQDNRLKESLEKIWNLFLLLLQKGNNTSFQVLKDKEHMASFPVTVLVLLLIFVPWVILPLIVIGLFFGFHYQFVSSEE